MIIYQGYARASGVTDFCDAAVFSSLLVVFKWPNYQMPIFKDEFGNPVRCPVSDIPGDRCRNPITMTRDNLVPLVAGYHAAGLIEEARAIHDLMVERKWMFPSGDIASPAVRDHFRRCAGLAPTKLGKAFLAGEIIWNAFVEPLDEPNQLVCMLKIAGDKWVKAWTLLNRKWKEAIRKYWDNTFRKAPEMSALMIKDLESYS